MFFHGIAPSRRSRSHIDALKVKRPESSLEEKLVRPSSFALGLLKSYSLSPELSVP